MEELSVRLASRRCRQLRSRYRAGVTEAGLAGSDINAIAILIVALIGTIHEALDLKTDYQVRVVRLDE